MMTIRRVNHPLDYYVKSLEEERPFSFARYGDGEWASALDKRQAPQKNCDGHLFFPEMHAQFVQVFQQLRDKPQVYDYWLGMQNMAYKMFTRAINGFLTWHKLLDREWHEADVFHKASIKGRLNPLISAFKRRTLIIVGPQHLRALRGTLGYNEFIQVPQRNCFVRLDALEKQTDAAIRRIPNPVVLIAASMPAELLLHRLYARHGRTASLIDVGSVLDPYAGVDSRRYHQGLKPDAIRAICPTTTTRVATGSIRGRRSR